MVPVSSFTIGIVKKRFSDSEGDEIHLMKQNEKQDSEMSNQEGITSIEIV